MTPAQKISVIECSSRCRIYGWFSLVPFAGIVMSILAFRDIRFVRKTCGTEWNPAGKCLKFGKFLAWTGLLISIIAICLVISVLIVEFCF